MSQASPATWTGQPPYRRVGQLSPSEDLFEVDMTANAVVAVGNQFGVGRLAG